MVWLEGSHGVQNIQHTICLFFYRVGCVYVLDLWVVLRSIVFIVVVIFVGVFVLVAGVDACRHPRSSTSRYSHSTTRKMRSRTDLVEILANTGSRCFFIIQK